MKEAYAQSIECEEPCEGRLSRTVLWEGEGETPSLYSTLALEGLGTWDGRRWDRMDKTMFATGNKDDEAYEEERFE